MNSSRISENNGGPAHKPYKVLIVQWWNKMDVAVSTKESVYRLLYLRIEMYWIHKMNLWMGKGQLMDGLANLFEAFAKGLSSVAGHQYDL